MNDKVTVIMATKDTKDEYLDCAIKSILNQTYKNVEFFIINDGGSNYNLLKSYTDERITIINHKNSKGLAFSINEAIERSSGKYIIRMDSDDISLPFRIKEQVKYMNTNKNIDICGTFYKCFGDKNEFVLNVLNKTNETKSQLYSKNILAHPSVIIRKEFLKKNNIKYSELFKYSQDFELWTRASQYGNIAILPKVCILYRRHSNQISSDKKVEQKSLYVNILERNLANLDIDKSYVKYLKMFNELEVVDYEKLYKFIKYSIKQNNKIQYYDCRTFKNALYYFFFMTALKNKKMEILLNVKYVRMIINICNIKCILKKTYYLIKEKILYKKRIRGVYIYD